jgi:hypothetical protein
VTNLDLGAINDIMVEGVGKAIIDTLTSVIPVPTSPKNLLKDPTVLTAHEKFVVVIHGLSNLSTRAWMLDALAQHQPEEFFRYLQNLAADVGAEFSGFIIKYLKEYEDRMKAKMSTSAHVEEIQMMHPSIYRKAVQKQATSWGYGEIEGLVTLFVRGAVLKYVANMWLERELWVQSWCSADAFFLDFVMQALVVAWVALRTFFATEHVRWWSNILYICYQKCGSTCGVIIHFSIRALFFALFLVALALAFYYTWWIPVLLRVAHFLGVDINAEAVHNKRLLLASMPSETSNVAYLFAAVRVFPPLYILFRCGVSVNAWYHLELKHENSSVFRCQASASDKMAHITSLFTTRNIGAAMCILMAIVTTESHMNIVGFDEQISNYTITAKDGAIKWMDNQLEVEGTESHSNEAKACARLLVDCREKAAANFTCLDMMEAVQGEGCASACASDIKKNIADMYESGEFVSLCEE